MRSPIKSNYIQSDYALSQINNGAISQNTSPQKESPSKYDPSVRKQLIQSEYNDQYVRQQEEEQKILQLKLEQQKKLEEIEQKLREHQLKMYQTDLQHKIISGEKESSQQESPSKKQKEISQSHQGQLKQQIQTDMQKELHKQPQGESQNIAQIEQQQDSQTQQTNMESKQDTLEESPLRKNNQVKDLAAMEFKQDSSLNLQYPLLKLQTPTIIDENFIPGEINSNIMNSLSPQQRIRYQQNRVQLLQTDLAFKRTYSPVRFIPTTGLADRYYSPIPDYYLSPRTKRIIASRGITLDYFYSLSPLSRRIYLESHDDYYRDPYETEFQYIQRMKKEADYYARQKIRTLF